jgi:hypothetical protein
MERFAEILETFRGETGEPRRVADAVYRAPDRRGVSDAIVEGSLSVSVTLSPGNGRPRDSIFPLE